MFWVFFTLAVLIVASNVAVCWVRSRRAIERMRVNDSLNYGRHRLPL